MLQVLQSLASGETTVEDVPVPCAADGQVLVRTDLSLISSGTERSLVEFGRANLLDKARQQPEKVRMLWNKIGTDGLLPTLDAARSKLEAKIPLGYCNVGTVVDLGAEVSGLSIGDRVVSNGPHAEFVSVPTNLCIRIPHTVDSMDAVFSVLGAVALQGIRLTAPTIGESFAVIGLGTIGLLAVRLLRANGCQVIACDFDERKLELARQSGASVLQLRGDTDPVGAAMAFSDGVGVDGVLIAAATQSNDPISWAARMCRTRGRIVLLGVTGLHLSRDLFYEKELSFQVSCSYGPGRYDHRYEILGLDYPIAYVRWTEQRNLKAIIELMSSGALIARDLVSHRFNIEHADEAYETLVSDEWNLGILLYYQSPPEQVARGRRIDLRQRSKQASAAGRNPVKVGIIGAGNYARRTLLPSLKHANIDLVGIASPSGLNARIVGDKFAFRWATSDVSDVLQASDVEAVLIATRHDSHADLVCHALSAGKSVFVEKPLAITPDQLARVETTIAELRDPLLCVGFNRRFAHLAKRMKERLAERQEPMNILMTVNAGQISIGHWTQDRSIGGGRIIGEACHFIDLARHMVGTPIIRVLAIAQLGPSIELTHDKASIILQFSDGSVADIAYLANGPASFPKERIEVFWAGRALRLDNFRSLTAYGPRGRARERSWRQDKGHAACTTAFIDAAAHGLQPTIPLSELFEVSRATLLADKLISEGGGAADL